VQNYLGAFHFGEFNLHNSKIQQFSFTLVLDHVYCLYTIPTQHTTPINLKSLGL